MASLAPHDGAGGDRKVAPQPSTMATEAGSTVAPLLLGADGEVSFILEVCERLPDARRSILAQLSLRRLHSLRGVNERFRRWAEAALATRPRAVLSGGYSFEWSDEALAAGYVRKSLKDAIVFDTLTLRWTPVPVDDAPPQPVSRIEGRALVPDAATTAGRGGGGAVFVLGEHDATLEQQGIPALDRARLGAPAQFGRLQLLQELPRMHNARHDFAAAQLPDGRVVVAGGRAHRTTRAAEVLERHVDVDVDVRLRGRGATGWALRCDRRREAGGYRAAAVDAAAPRAAALRRSNPRGEGRVRLHCWRHLQPPSAAAV